MKIKSRDRKVRYSGDPEEEIIFSAMCVFMSIIACGLIILVIYAIKTLGGS